MGKLYRFVEPLVLYLLHIKRRSCGYDLDSELREHTLTDTEIDKAALYRTLRQLEANGNVKSEWQKGHGGPPRRVYWLTRTGEHHLEEWTKVLDNLSKSMASFAREAHSSLHNQ
jgi:PadR family transcriptional regulator, regulatory protein PadR